MWKIAGFIVAGFIMATTPVRQGLAGTIGVGPYTATTGAPFLVPIDMEGALDLSSWTVDIVTESLPSPAERGSAAPVDFVALSLATADVTTPVVLATPAGNTLPEPAPVLLICGAFVLAMLQHRRREPSHGRLSLRTRALAET